MNISGQLLEVSPKLSKILAMMAHYKKISVAKQFLRKVVAGKIQQKMINFSTCEVSFVKWVYFLVKLRSEVAIPTFHNKD